MTPKKTGKMYTYVLNILATKLKKVTRYLGKEKCCLAPVPVYVSHVLKSETGGLYSVGQRQIFLNSKAKRFAFHLSKKREIIF